MTPGQLKSLRISLNHFDRCCWSRDDHRAVLKEIQEQGEKLTLVEQQRDDTDFTFQQANEQLGQYEQTVQELREENATLHQSLAHVNVLFSNYLHDTSDDLHCLPTCGTGVLEANTDHEELCPSTNPYVAWTQLRTELSEREKRIETLTQALRQLARRHEGYQLGMGPCVCDEHRAAAALLVETSPHRKADSE